MIKKNKHNIFGSVMDEFVAHAIRNEILRSYVTKKVCSMFTFEDLRLLPICEYAAIQDVADWFDMPLNALRAVLKRFQSEYGADHIKMPMAEYKEWLISLRQKMLENGYDVSDIEDGKLIYVDNNNETQEISHCHFITKTGIIKLVLMLNRKNMPVYVDEMKKKIIGIFLREYMPSCVRESNYPIKGNENQGKRKRSMFMTSDEEKILESTDIRSKYVQSIGKNALDFLNSITEVSMIKGFGYLTFNMIVSYLDVPFYIVQDVYCRHIDEFEDCVISQDKTICPLFTPMAIIRLAMLINDYPKPHEIRMELTRVYPNIERQTVSKYTVLQGQIEEMRMKIERLKQENSELIFKRTRLKAAFKNISMNIEGFNI